VPDQADVTYTLDGRVTNQDVLTGSGMLNLEVNYNRADLEGDWTGFSGVLNVITSGTGDLRFGGNNSCPEASVIINENLNAYHLTGGTVVFGSLMLSAGAVLKDADWKIGANAEESVLSGEIQGNSFIKTGTGRLIIDGNSNTYSGGTTVEGGTLWIKNISGSATGTGNVTVLNGASVGGDGTISGNLEMQGGSTLSPGDEIGMLTIDSTLTMQKSSILMQEVTDLAGVGDMIKAKSVILNEPILFIRNNSGDEFEKGDRVIFFDAESIGGKLSGIYPKYPGDSLYWDYRYFYSDGFIFVTDVEPEPELVPEDRLTGLQVYPNPTRGEIMVETRAVNEDIRLISILNSKGCVLEQFVPNNSIRLDISGNPEGLYILRFETGERVYNEKVFLIK